MATQKKRYPLAEAAVVAENLRVLLAPACARLVVAGSIRRRRPDPGDIELVAAPRFEQRGQAGFFGEGRYDADLLAESVEGLMAQGVLVKRKASNGRYIGYGALNKFLLHVESQIPVDLFTATSENFGMTLLVRTGSASYCVKVMSRLKALGYRGHAYGGISLSDGTEIECPTEKLVYQYLGWPWLEPSKRE